jgi:hypothetical protein
MDGLFGVVHRHSADRDQGASACAPVGRGGSVRARMSPSVELAIRTHAGFRPPTMNFFPPGPSWSVGRARCGPSLLQEIARSMAERLAANAALRIVRMGSDSPRKGQP